MYVDYDKVPHQARVQSYLKAMEALAGRYPAAAAMVIFALVPYLGLSAALQPLAPIIGGQLHMSAQTMSLGLGLANAGYAVGTVLAVQFISLGLVGELIIRMSHGSQRGVIYRVREELNGEPSTTE